MNVTDSYFNDTISAGIVYTVGGVTVHGSDNGYVGVRSASGTYITDTSDGIRVTASDNISCDNLNVWDCTDDGICVSISDNITITNSNVWDVVDDGIYFVQTTNSTITAGTVCNNSGDSGIKLESSSLNDISAIHNHHNLDDFYIDANSNNNTLDSCSGGFSTDGFYLIGSNNTFNFCESYNQTDAGFSLVGGHGNILDTCTGYYNNEGMEVYGNPNNNSIIDGNFSNNDWGLFMWPNAGNTCQDNNFTDCMFSNNTESAIDYGRAKMNHFWNCIIFNNTGYGIEVSQGGIASFDYITNFNLQTTKYDWMFDDNSTVDIDIFYLLGYNITNTINPLPPLNHVSHDVGQGTWNLTSTVLLLNISVGTGAVVLQQWNEDLTIWNVTALAGDLIQMIYGLRANSVYDLMVDGLAVDRVMALPITVLWIPTGYLVFNYSGGWSTHEFRVDRVGTTPSGGGTTTPGGVQIQTSEPSGEPEGFSIANSVIFVFIILIAMCGSILAFYLYRKS
jgi:hypothetical protein